MAYLAFHDADGGTANGAVRCDHRLAGAAPAPDGRLTALEWSVVMLARQDRRSSLRRPGRLSTAIRALLNQRNPMLADPRLEALRRMAVLSWYDGYAVPTYEMRAFLHAGFTIEQYETMVTRIGALKATRHDRSPAVEGQTAFA